MILTIAMKRVFLLVQFALASSIAKKQQLFSIAANRLGRL